MEFVPRKRVVPNKLSLRKSQIPKKKEIVHVDVNQTPELTDDEELDEFMKNYKL